MWPGPDPAVFGGQGHGLAPTQLFLEGWGPVPIQLWRAGKWPSPDPAVFGGKGPESLAVGRAQRHHISRPVGRTGPRDPAGGGRGAASAARSDDTPTTSPRGGGGTRPNGCAGEGGVTCPEAARPARCRAPLATLPAPDSRGSPPRRTGLPGPPPPWARPVAYLPKPSASIPGAGLVQQAFVSARRTQPPRTVPSPLPFTFAWRSGPAGQSRRSRASERPIRSRQARACVDWSYSGPRPGAGGGLHSASPPRAEAARASPPAWFL